MVYKINLLTKEFELIKNMGWIKSLRKGPTGIGYTFETLLGKEEDSFCSPDYYGFEIKTHRTKSSSYIGLFNYDPIGDHSYQLKYIYDKYGYCSTKNRKLKVLNTSVYSNYIRDVGINYKFSLQVDEVNNKVLLLVFDRLGNFIENNSYWSFDVLKEKLYKKMQYLAYIEADSKYINGCEYFKYTKICFFKLRDFDTFIILLKKGKIRVNFKVSAPTDTSQVINSHGTSFCIKSEDLNLLYDFIN